MFDNTLIDFIVHQTKLCAMQKDGKEMRLDNTDMRCFMVILLPTGIIKVPRYRAYLKLGLNLTAVANNE